MYTLPLRAISSANYCLNRFWPYKGADYKGLVAEYIKTWGLNEAVGEERVTQK